MSKRAGTGGVLVQTRVNLDTGRWVEKQAAAEGVSVAQWVRSLIVDKRRARQPPKPRDPLLRIADALDALAAVGRVYYGETEVGPPRCSALHYPPGGAPNGYACTLPPGHDGPMHVCALGKTVQWPVVGGAK